LASEVVRCAEIGESEVVDVRWMCGVSLKKRISSKELNERMGVVCVADVVRQGRLRWFGHLVRKRKVNGSLLVDMCL